MNGPKAVTAEDLVALLRVKYPARRKLEDPIVHRGDELCAIAGGDSIHFSQARASNQTPGIPDRLYFFTSRPKPVALWWEAKASDGLWLYEQQKFQAHCLCVGWEYVVGGYRELFDRLIDLGLWKLPEGIEVERVAGPRMTVRRETLDQCRARLARRKR